MSSAATRDPDHRPLTRILILLGALLATVIVTMGAINEASGSGFACPTWPGCYPGHFGPERELHAIIEFGHRVVAGLAGPVLLLAAILALRLPRHYGVVKVMPWLALLGAIGAAAFGMMTVRDHGLSKPLSVLDLFGALTCMVAMTLAFLSVNRRGPRWRWTPLVRVAALCLAGLYVVHLLGIVVAGNGSFTAVLGWPLWRLPAEDVLPWLAVVRMLLAAAVVGGLALLAVRAWRHTGLRTPVIILAIAFVVEMIVGQVVALEGSDLIFIVAYCAAAVAILSATTFVLGRAAYDDLA